MVGLDRAKQARCCLGATYDEEGRRDHAGARRSLRHAGDGDRQHAATISARRASASSRSPLDTPDQAERFHRRLVNACLRAHAQDEPVRPGQLHVAIIGAGATGTELAAELHRTARALVAFGLDRIDPEKDIRITLIEGAAAHPAGAARAHLERHHRSCCASSASTSARRAGHRGARGRRAAGRRRLHPVRAGRLGRRREGPGRAAPISTGSRSAAPTSSSSSRRSRPPATPTSSPSATARSCSPPGQERPLPPRAQAAHQQASHLLRQIRRRLDGRKPLSRSSTATSARWSRSASTPRSAT